MWLQRVLTTDLTRRLEHMTMMSSSESNEVHVFLLPARFSSSVHMSRDKETHSGSVRKVGSLNRMVLLISNILACMKKANPGPDRHEVGPLCLSAMDVPWMMCCCHPWPVASFMSCVHQYLSFLCIGCR